MKTENAVLMKQAREALAGNWGLAAGVFAIYLLIIISIQAASRQSPVIGLASLVIGGPFATGIAIFSLSLSRSQPAQINQIFEGFRNFGTSAGAYLLIVLLVLLWMLLLIIPGIIAALSYSQTFFIIAENPSAGAMEAIDRSKKMMEGYKLKLFYLELRFLGWALLCILTLGIGFIFLLPYMQVTLAKFYDGIKETAIAESPDLSP